MAVSRIGLLACPRRRSLRILICPILLAAAAQSPYRATIRADNPAIHYATAPTADPAAKLIDCNAPLDLAALLHALHIDTSSQALVFAKDSFQASRISPRNPRAIYFTDDAAVGWVRGSHDLEIAATDPHLGPVFYKYSTETGRLTRETVCLQCHQGAATLGVPGIFVGSVFPDSTGTPRATAPSSPTTELPSPTDGAAGTSPRSTASNPIAPMALPPTPPNRAPSPTTANAISRASQKKSTSPAISNPPAT